MILLSVALALALGQSVPRACADGVTIVAIDAGPSQSPVTVAEATSFAELAAIRRELPVLTAAAAKRARGNPELVLTQHVKISAPDEVFFVVRAELRELGRDAQGSPAQVVVWQGTPLAGLTSRGSAKDILNMRIEQAVVPALRECASTAKRSAP